MEPESVAGFLGEKHVDEGGEDKEGDVEMAGDELDDEDVFDDGDDPSSDVEVAPEPSVYEKLGWHLPWP